jgi:spore coat protein SA
MIYHMLCEPFSATNGLALSSIAANTMRFMEESVAVCPDGDDTWGFPVSRMLIIPAAGLVRKVRGWRFFPKQLRRCIMSYVFRPLLSRLRPGDIVWFYNWHEVAAPLQPIIQAKGVKLVYHAHNSHELYALQGGFKVLTPDALIFVSDAMRKEVLAVVPTLRNACTIHNGVDEMRFFTVPNGHTHINKPLVILFVGRLVPYKGAHILLRAMHLLQQRGVDAVCRVIGSTHTGDHAGKTTPYIRSLRKEAPSNVEFLGFRTGTEIADEYRASDILCCPSLFEEPFGLVNIEAMGCALPVVATRVGGIPEIASEGGIILVDPGSPQAIADALQRLIENPELRESLGVAGLASFNRRFTSTTVVRKYLEVADSLVKVRQAYE